MTLLRRSVLVMTAYDAMGREAAKQSRADAICFDGAPDEILPQDFVPRGMDLLVPISRESIARDLELAVRRSAHAVVVRGLRAPDELTVIDEMLRALESDGASVRRPIEITVVIDSAVGVWKIGELARASARVEQLWLDEHCLAEELGAVPGDGLDPLSYARGRFISETMAAGRQPIGELLSLTDVISIRTARARIRKAKDLGYKGIVCRNPALAAVANAVYTPRLSDIQHAKRVRDAFQAGLAAGTASVPLDDRMIDVPVARRADAVLAFAHLCQDREQAKDRSTLARPAAADRTSARSATC